MVIKVGRLGNRNRMKKNSFRELEAYKNGKLIIKEVYRLIRKFPKEEQYALCDQLRRAAISITSNIAEGSGRTSLKEKVHFIEISYGSLLEVLSQLDVACDLGYITPAEFNAFEEMENYEAILLSGIKNSFMKKLQSL